MRLRRTGPAVMIVATAVILAATMFLSNRLFSGLTDSVEQGQFALMRSIVDSSLRSAEGRALARAQMIADLPSVRGPFAARDRPRVLAECAQLFRVQREQYGVDQMQFHVPPARSFLRLHSPAQFDDDLSSFRPLVVNVNRTRAPGSGGAIARGGPAIFGVVPVQDLQGQHAGTVEIGIDYGGVLDGIKSAYGLEAGLYVLERPLREVATGMSPEVLSDQNRQGRFIRVHTTHGALLRQLVEAGDLDRGEDSVHYVRVAQGTAHGVLLTPIRNGAGQTFAVLAVSRDFSASRAAAGRSRVWQGLLGLFALVLIAGAILVVVRGMMLAPEAPPEDA